MGDLRLRLPKIHLLVFVMQFVNIIKINIHSLIHFCLIYLSFVSWPHLPTQPMKEIALLISDEVGFMFCLPAAVSVFPSPVCVSADAADVR